MTILAKELVNRAYDVSFVTFENSNRFPENINGIKVYNIANTNDLLELKERFLDE